MVPSSMNPVGWLREQLETADVDLLREMVRTLAEALMSAEADPVCGAGNGEVTKERVNRRNGYRERAWDTRVGPVLSGRTRAVASNRPSEAQTLRTVERVAIDALPPGWSLRARREARGRRQRDVEWTVRAPDGISATFAVEVKRSLVGRQLDFVLAQLAAADGRRRPLIAAPYLGPTLRASLADRGVSFADATGNIRLICDRPGLFVERRGATVWHPGGWACHRRRDPYTSGLRIMRDAKRTASRSGSRCVSNAPSSSRRAGSWASCGACATHTDGSGGRSRWRRPRR